MATAKRKEPRVDIREWADAVEPDYLGKTACGLWFCLITWKRAGVEHYAFGFAKTEAEALEQGRLQALSTRFQAGRG